MRKLALAPVVALIAAAAFGQALTLPPSGDNQHAIVTQFIGPVKVTVDYNSPKVHHPTTHEDRRGKIYGALVPYGLVDQGFGTCHQCPWRAGANQNTTFTFSDPVKVEGQDLPAGTYGFFLIPEKDGDWTAIFSKNSTSWGSFFYDAAEDQLRVKVKPEKSEYNEWLTYDFTERQPDHATVAMKWEDLQVPVHISVPNITDVYLTHVKQELRNSPGFTWTSWNQAARYALREKRLDDALQFAKGATDTTFGIGVENFQTLTTLGDVLEARGNAAEAKAAREKALAMGNALDLHQYARAALQRGHKDEAIRVWQMNAKAHPNAWPVNVGLMRAYSAQGDYKSALKYAKLALPQAPDPANKKSLEDSIKKLEEGKDVNS